MALQAAMPEEASGLLKAGQWRRVPISSSFLAYQGYIGGVGAVLAISGIGRVRAEATARSILEQLRPRSMLSVGFAGGLIPGQRAGDLVAVQTLLPVLSALDRGHQRLDLEPIGSHGELLEEARQVMAGLDLRHCAGPCVTASHVVSGPDEKKRLAETTDAVAVDMESYWVAAACKEFHVPFLAVRSIVDDLDNPLPDFIAQAAWDSGPRGMWRRALPTLLRPQNVPRLARLAFAASTARRSLSKFVEAFVGASKLNVAA